MEKKTTFFVSHKSVLTWIMALCLVASAVTRIVFACMEGVIGGASVWSQIVLPVAATLLYVAIVLLAGREFFFKTSVAIWGIALYYCLTFNSYGINPFIASLYWIAWLFFCVLYTAIVSGWLPIPMLLVPLFATPVGVTVLLHREVLIPLNLESTVSFLPDALLFGGLLVLSLAVRPHPHGTYHPTWGDRPDGRRVRSLPPMSQVSPYLMVHRNESSNLFADSFEITGLERYIRQKRLTTMPNLGFMHIMLAGYVRCVAKYPALNRFLSGQKVYSRGTDIQFCITVKKEMSTQAPDTCIKVHLHPGDTLQDVYDKVNAEVEKVKNTPLDSGFDSTAQVFTLIPGVLLKFVVWLLKLLDYFGLLPKFLLEVSPFHGSIFLTSMGSLGIPPVYHHLYDFGNLPVFGAFGMKRRVTEVLPDGTVVKRKYIDCKFTTDERVCDGYCYAAFFKYFKRLVSHPEVLELPPEEINTDIP